MFQLKSAPPARALKPYRNWSQLVGEHVEVWLEGEYIRNGRVEDVMPDDSILWVAAEGARTRQLFDKFSGYEVRL